ncbi:putative E3 ubiquitin-protein ligase [Neonectria punicea]|uniref:HECT-type E3 ubiquitin transferase n=1 Tax=Neonectria punicea TaxID=979145 RepID=A0ABR1H810_9HYPO
MAPWSNRRGSQPNNHSSGDLVSRIHHSALNTSATISPELGSRFDLSNAHVDSSDSDADFHAASSSRPSRSHRPQHSRSMSQPFPSLFSGKKKKRQSSVGGPPPDLGFADDDGALPTPPPPMRPTTKTHTRSGPAGSKDFATGNCMTCGSLVRWPRELKVFKCTICMTVNDLEPQTAESQGSGGSRWRRDATQGPSSSPQPTPPRIQHISVEHTRRLVDQCIRSHLTKKLAKQPPHAPETQPAPRSMNKLSFSSRMQANGQGTGPSGVTQGAAASASSMSPAIRVSQHLFDEEPTLRANPLRTNSAPVNRPYSTSYPERPPGRGVLYDEAPKVHQRSPSRSPDDDPKRIFKSLEDYIIACFSTFECVNSSFVAHHLRHPSRSEPVRRKPVVPVPPVPQREPPRVPREPHESREPREHRDQPQPNDGVWDLDPKLLLLGNFAENGTWWTVGQEEAAAPSKSPPIRSNSGSMKPYISSRSPHIHWGDLVSWYSLITNAAKEWFNIYEELSRGEEVKGLAERELRMVERDLLHAQDHSRRVLLKATEMLLKRPGRPLKDPAELRFLLIILENPLLHRDHQRFRGMLQPDIEPPATEMEVSQSRKSPAPESGPLSGQHSGIIKRIVGLTSNSSIECHNQLITWFAKYQLSRFVKTKELVADFLTYRMLRQSEKKPEVKVDITAGLIPQMHEGRSGAYLYDEINVSNSSKKPKEPVKKFTYTEDWQIRASSRFLALLFAANNLPHVRRGDEGSSNSNDNLGAVRDVVHAQGQLLPTSDFYNSMIDYADLVADFENWEARRGKFSFCQYPFLLSIWAKNHILEHDARRQMQSKARDAFFDSIMSRRSINQFMVLDVRRDCLVDDSLKAVSEVIGSGSEDIKKGLRIIFKGEEGIDGGGLRKEWFLLLVREVFNPDHGLFLYDEDSQYCWFNPNSFETSDQFFLIGVVMGLAIYNSTILDVALPPFAFRKLISSAPTHGTGASAHPRPAMRYTLEDLAEYHPRLARGLRQLLEYEGDVETTFCLDFVIETERYGNAVQVPLCPGGERIPVTSSNRRDYVDLYIRYILDVAVTRQFEPFKRGFYTVCGGNALSLFRPDEIELLVRGSDEELDISSLRAVAEYDNWGTKKPDGSEPIISWFWETFQAATPQDQRKLLLFITGSDRIPAMGATLLPIKISCLGDDASRFPMARTCFNFLSLSRYESKDKLEKMLWTAVHESEGFGLK